MNFFKNLFNWHKKPEKKEPEKKQLTGGEPFYTPLEEIIPIFFEGKIEKRPFFQELVNIPLIMATINEEKTQPLVISKSKEDPLVVFTTSKERLEQISQAFPDVTGKAEVSLAHYMNAISEPVSIVINPGWKFEFTISKESVTELMSSISMEFCNLDIMVSRYISNQISMNDLIKAINDYNFGIILQEENAEEVAHHMAYEERAGEQYSCVFSSEEFAKLYRENHPEFQYSAHAKGEGMLQLLPENCGIIINPESDFEILINALTLNVKKQDS